MNVRERILQTADELFHQYGVKSITMDEIARTMSISKKTIYQFFSDKDEIVKEVCERVIAINHQEMEEIKVTSVNTLEECWLTSVCIKRNLGRMNPVMLLDLQRYHPAAWQAFLEFKNRHIKGVILHNLERGIAEGYYRKDIHREIIARWRLEQVQLAFNPLVFPPTEFSLIEVQMEMLEHFIRGLLTPQGQLAWEELKAQKLNETSNP